ncbi:MAG: phosphate regulon sensor histidine kinase PhoR [Gammaproteobacteria bacterium]|nr:phosphate regulon sensor histidine kinase PhoR [Gammaproteobacteria bacterium]
MAPGVLAALGWRVALVFLAALFLGLTLGGLAWWLFAGALGLFLYLAYAAWGLEQWLRTGKRRSEAAADGVLGAVYADIVQLKQRARRRKKRFNRLLREVRDSTDAMHDGGVILNADMEITWLNDAASRLLGLDRSRDQGQHITNLVRHPDFVAYIEQAEFSEKLKMPGPRRNTHLSVQLIPYGNQQKLLIVQDFTREVRLEHMRRDFVANVSHELRSPLTVIAGYLESLGDENSLDEVWREPVAEMQRQVARMNSIVHDLITLSRLEAAERPAGQEPVDVPGMLGQLHRDALARRERPGELELRLETPALVRGEEQELHSVFSNLLNNALRFTPADGRIECRWWQDERGLHFSLTDTGIGIPEALIPRVTERFFRVDSGRAREVGGTGLGLAIVKHALLRHGGQLEIQSRPGEGSTFTCHFPPSRVVLPADEVVQDAGEAH